LLAAAVAYRTSKIIINVFERGENFLQISILNFAFRYLVNRQKSLWKVEIYADERSFRKGASQWEKSPKEQSEECIFDNMALYFECRINNTHSFRLFSAIFPTGLKGE